MPKLCAVDGCDGTTKGKGYCSRHYRRFKRYGDPLAGGRFYEPRGQGERECSVRGCGSAVLARTYCAKHYKRWQIHGDPLVYKAQTRNNEPCSVDGCRVPFIARGLCGKHYARWQTHGDPTVVKLPTRRSTWRPDGHGYVVRYWPEHPNAGGTGVVSQHVAVMSEHLGRPLRKGESVHHVNGVRSDNRIENLELWAKAHPPGQRVSELIAFAHEIVERYRDDPQLWPEGLQP